MSSEKAAGRGRTLRVAAAAALLLAPYIVISYSVLGAEGALPIHRVRDVAVPPKPPEGRTVRVALDGSGDFASVVEAVKAAGPGDRIVVAPGIYREAVVVEEKPWLTIEGARREDVVLDGGGMLGNGIYVLASPHVRITNLTVRNYHGNGIFYIYSDYFEITHANIVNNKVYGINFMASEKGRISHVVATGSGDSGIYVGEVSEKCDCVVEDSEAYNNTLGYSGTRAQGVTIRNSWFHDNAMGLGPNTLLPDLRMLLMGEWPLVLKSSGNTFENNVIENNNNKDIQAAGFLASYSAPRGVGVALVGSSSNVLKNNTIRGHERWGVAEWYFGNPPVDNRFEANAFSGNGLDYWRDGWGFSSCSSGERATGDVPPPCDGALRLSFPNPLKQLELLKGLAQ